MNITFLLEKKFSYTIKIIFCILFRTEAPYSGESATGFTGLHPFHMHQTHRLHRTIVVDRILESC